MRVRLSFNEMEDWPYIDWSRPEVPITAEQDAFIDRLVKAVQTQGGRVHLGAQVSQIAAVHVKSAPPQGVPSSGSK